MPRLHDVDIEVTVSVLIRSSLGSAKVPPVSWTVGATGHASGTAEACDQAIREATDRATEASASHAAAYHVNRQAQGLA